MPAIRLICAGVALILVLITSCTSKSGKSFVPGVPGYNDKLREVYILNDDLLEISGLVNLGDLRFAAVNDEEGELFFIDLARDSITKTRFKGKGDYEELVKVDSTYYVLESSGDIIEVNPPYTDQTTYKFSKKNMEFESLVYYPDRGKLVMIIKDRKKRKEGIAAYSFDLAKKKFDPKPFFVISFKEVFTILTNYNTECKPSAAALNPANKKLYIIAAVGMVLLECSANGKLEHIYKLNPTHFSQPEGISFATNGDMFISNEGAEGKATILKFPYGGVH
ncbi:MAG: hypothetical protein JNK79_11720 [Chitinophagaceae bacterium]|nr:hypothetical protein [Chitinophagaceae bacterium]